MTCLELKIQGVNINSTGDNVQGYLVQGQNILPPVSLFASRPGTYGARKLFSWVVKMLHNQIRAQILEVLHYAMGCNPVLKPVYRSLSGDQSHRLPYLFLQKLFFTLHIGDHFFRNVKSGSPSGIEQLTVTQTQFGFNSLLYSTSTTY
jgi:hypothetical protein